MGVNARGLFVGLTNRPTRDKDPRRRSRGLLVVDALGEPSARAALARVDGDLAERPYNPFHMLCCDGEESWLLSLHEDELRRRPLAPGLHVLANGDPDDAADRKLRRIRDRVGGLDGATPLDAALEMLRAVLTEHCETAPLEGVCIHMKGYGTRSSGMFVLGASRRHFWYADGPPCEAKYRDLTPLLEGFRPGRESEGEVIEANR